MKILLVSLLLASLTPLKLWVEGETRFYIYIICFIVVFIGMPIALMVFYGIIYVLSSICTIMRSMTNYFRKDYYTESVLLINGSITTLYHYFPRGYVRMRSVRL